MGKTNLRIRSCAVCVRSLDRSSSEILLVKLKDPQSGEEFWTPPGGMIEPGEESLAAALRETLEETGERIRGLGHLPVQLRYEFHWNGAINDCLTDFHLCEPIEPKAAPNEVHDASYWLEARWFLLEEGLRELDLARVTREAGIGNAVKETLKPFISRS